MRVPIFQSDLLTNRHFKRISKELHAKWLFPQPLNLMSAQEILAQGLGYRDFHDLRLSANQASRALPVPTMSEARGGIATSIVAFLHSKSVVTIDYVEIDRLVMLLPLNELKTFRQAEGKGTANQLPTETGEGDPQSDSCQYIETSPLNHRPSAPGLVSVEDLTLIADAVRRGGSDRDNALIGIVMSGVRAAELEVLKPCDIQRDASGSNLRIRAFKVRDQHAQFKLPNAMAELLHQYVSQAGLSEGDWLFPSPSNPKRPMSPREMNKIIKVWAGRALMDSKLATSHTLRRSSIEAGLSSSQCDVPLWAARKN